jgi:hypothetical protein
MPGRHPKRLVEDDMMGRLSVKTGCVCLLLVGCGSVRDLGNIHDGGAGTMGSGGTSQGGAGGSTGTGGAAAGTGGAAAGTGGAAAGTGGDAAGGGGAAAGTGGGAAGSGGATVCTASQPFGAPVLVPGVPQDGSNDGDGRLSPDERTIVFWSDRAPNGIYIATRTSRNSPFETPQPVTAINSATGGAFPSLSGDGMTIFFESDKSGGYQIYASSRINAGAPFSAPTPVAIPTFMASDGKAYVLADESAIYFVSYRAGPGAGDIYRSQILSGLQVGTPVLLPAINSSSSDYDPVVTPDELTIYFASDRGDPAAKGTFDIWMSRRDSIGAAFDPPVNVQEVNSSAIEEPSWISPDNCRLYLYRQGADSYYKIYVASRSP